MLLNRIIAVVATVGIALSGVVHAQTPGLKLVVLEGEDSVNIIDKKTAVKPTVEVRDQNDLPVAGASVVFLIQGGRNSATFANGLRQVTLTTNSLGRATVSELNPLGKGAFQIQVRASFQGQAATATIHQANFATEAAAQAAHANGASSGSSSGSSAGQTAATGGLSHAAIIGIVGAAGAAASVGAVVVAKNASQSAANDVNNIINSINNALNLTGNWSAQVTSTQSSSASTGVIQLSQSGSTISGKDITPTPIVGGGLPAGTSVSYTNSITGSVSGSAVTLTLTGVSSSSATVAGFTATSTCSETVKMSLTASSSSSMSGTYTETVTCTSNPAVIAPINVSDSGRITATKQ